MTKKKIRPNPEPVAPGDPPIRRLLAPADGDGMDARQFKDFAGALKSLADAGLIKIPSQAPAVVHAPASRGIEGAVDELEKYIDGFARAQALAARLNPSGGVLSALKEIADTKFGEQIGTVAGELASGLVKSKVREGELAKELQLEAMRLERAKVERGLVVGGPGVVTVAPAHSPAPAAMPESVREVQLTPAAQDLITAHAAKMDATNTKMDRIEQLLLSMKAPGSPPTPRPGPSAPKKKPGRPPKMRKEPSTDVEVECGICGETVQVKDAKSQMDIGDRFALLHAGKSHPKEWAAARAKLAEGLSRGPEGMAEIAKLQDSLMQIRYPGASPPKEGQGDDSVPANPAGES